jgi:uncharacterized protein (DUF427 family)
MSLTLGTGPLGARPGGAFNFDLAGASPAHRIYFAEEPRRLRAVVGDVVVLDTTRARLLYETAIAPRIYAPLEDYALAGHFAPTDTTSHCPFKGDARYWTLRAGGVELADVLWAYDDPKPEAAFLAGHAALYEDRVDWLVEDDAVFGRLRDPFHRVDVHDSSREVVVRVGGTVVARTDRAKLLFETGAPVRAYLPRAELRGVAVTPGSGRRTVCPYKGEATYWTVAGVTDAALSYEAPLPDALRAAGHLCFDDGVDGVEVEIA